MLQSANRFAGLKDLNRFLKFTNLIKKLELLISWAIWSVWLLREAVRRFGIPLVMYRDRHGSLHRNDSQWSLEEQLSGRQEPTQVGLAPEVLGIESIAPLSPQAKGRIERLFGTLQYRLIAELGLQEVQSLEAANRFLKVFIPRFNRRFAIPPRESEKAWRKVSPELDLDRMISFRYRLVVRNDNSVRIGGLILNLPPGTPPALLH